MIIITDWVMIMIKILGKLKVIGFISIYTSVSVEVIIAKY